jgi:hypothetical protein
MTHLGSISYRQAIDDPCIRKCPAQKKLERSIGRNPQAAILRTDAPEEIFYSKETGNRFRTLASRKG